VVDRCPKHPTIAQNSNPANVCIDARPSKPLAFASRIPQTGLYPFHDEAARQFSHSAQQREKPSSPLAWTYLATR